eukprot:Gb_24503 [translate_table: standard]
MNDVYSIVVTIYHSIRLWNAALLFKSIPIFKNKKVFTVHYVQWGNLNYSQTESSYCWSREYHSLCYMRVDHKVDLGTGYKASLCKDEALCYFKSPPEDYRINVMVEDEQVLLRWMVNTAHGTRVLSSKSQTKLLVLTGVAIFLLVKSGHCVNALEMALFHEE